MKTSLKSLRTKRTSQGSILPAGTAVLTVAVSHPTHTSTTTLVPGADISSFYRGPGKGLPPGAVLAIEQELDRLNKLRITGG